VKKLVKWKRPPLEAIVTGFILALLGVLGNYIHISLFFGVDFLFGGVAVLLTVSLLGWRAGVVVGAIASAYTYVLWGHPYAVFAFTLEAIVVGFLSQRRRWTLMAAEAAYWFAIGIPLVYYCYHVYLESSATSAWTIALKQASNGLFCALLVSGLLLLPAVRVWSVPESRVRARRLRDLVVELSVALTFFALLLSSAIDSHIARQQIETEVYRQLSSVATSTRAQIDTWQTWDDRDPELLANFIRTQHYPLDVTIFLESTQLDVRIEHHCGEPAMPLPASSTVRYVADRLDQYFPAGDMPLLRRWRQSVYQLEASPTSASPWSLKIVTSVAPHIDRLEALYSQKLLRLLCLTGGVLAFASSVMRVVSRPLRVLDCRLGSRAPALPDSSSDDTPDMGSATGSSMLVPTALEPLLSSPVLEFRAIGQSLRKLYDGRSIAIADLDRRNRELLETLQAVDATRIEQGTEAARLKHALLQNRQRLSGVWHHSPIVAIEWQLGGQIVEWNPGAYARFGYMESEAIGRSLRETILPAGECANLFESVRAKSETMEPFRSTHVTQTKSGQLIVCDWFNRPIVSSEGRVTAIVSVIAEASDLDATPPLRHDSEIGASGRS